MHMCNQIFYLCKCNFLKLTIIYYGNYYWQKITNYYNCQKFASLKHYAVYIVYVCSLTCSSSELIN